MNTGDEFNKKTRRTQIHHRDERATITSSTNIKTNNTRKGNNEDEK